MGFIRTLLAISVVLSHTSPIWGYALIGGVFPVRLFFIISGFYMALILNKKYPSGNYSLFITNRFLRIYPLYWLILSTSLLLDFFTNSLHNLTFLSMISDVTLLVRLDYFAFNPANNMLANLRIGQAWTLVVELLFYLVVPFLINRKWLVLFSLGFLSIAIHYLVFHFQSIHGYQPTPEAFAPANLIFFILGITAFKIYNKIYNKQIPHYILGIFTIVIILFILMYLYLPDFRVRYISAKEMLLYISVTLSLPFIFRFAQKSKIDRLVGELSYPIYLWHTFVAAVSLRMLPSLKGNEFTLLVLFFSIVFSILSYKLIISPLDKYRDRRVKHIVTKKSIIDTYP